MVCYNKTLTNFRGSWTNDDDTVRYYNSLDDEDARRDFVVRAAIMRECFFNDVCAMLYSHGCNVVALLPLLNPGELKAYPDAVEEQNQSEKRFVKLKWNDRMEIYNRYNSGDTVYKLADDYNILTADVRRAIALVGEYFDAKIGDVQIGGEE